MLTLDGIKGVGDATLKKLHGLGIKSVFELFSFLPSKYIDLGAPISVAFAEAGQLALFEGRVEKITSLSNRGKRAFGIYFSDTLSNGRIRFRATFYNMPYLHSYIEVGQEYRLFARLTNDAGAFYVVNPIMEKKQKLSKLQGVYPIYPLKGVMGQSAFKNILYAALDSANKTEYAGVLKSANEKFIRCFDRIHRPASVEEGYNAIQELSSLDLGISLSIYRKIEKNRNNYRKVFYNLPKNVIDNFETALKFTPTQSQHQCFESICQRLKSSQNMSAIVSGDVGSGKTAVAFFAAYLAATCHKQAAIMAPTEILASQHSEKFAPIAEALDIKYALLTAATPSSEKADILFNLEHGMIDVVIGTQSLLSDPVKFADLSIGIIDEQHKFGVNERTLLEKKGAADILSLTATPIPRSLALTFYENIDVYSVERRASTQFNVSTEVFFDISEALDKIVDGVKQGNKAFIVCPSIYDSEGFAAMSMESFLRDYADKLEGLRYICLHGKMSDRDKREAMQKFCNGNVSVLIATTVVEVGIDTDACDILVLNADRFGLASLHQLRGRVGRFGQEAHCYLHSGSKSEKALTRLKAMCDSNDGRYLAEVDFELRGSGEIVGTRQSGASLTPLFGLPTTSAALLEAKNLADGILSPLTLDDLLALTRRSEARAKEFVAQIDKVTLNS